MCEETAKAGRMTCLGRWSLRGDVLAGDQSHQLAGKHRDGDWDARSCWEPTRGNARLPSARLLATRRDEIINVLIHSLSHAALTPPSHSLSFCPCLALSLCLCFFVSAVTRRLTSQSSSTATVFALKWTISSAAQCEPDLRSIYYDQFTREINNKDVQMFQGRLDLRVVLTVYSRIFYTVFQKKHPLILLAISWGIVVRF